MVTAGPTGAFRHTVLGTFDADRHGIRAGDYVL